MATFLSRPNGWQAQVRRRGRRTLSRTFRTKADAQAWAAQIESEIVRGVYRDRCAAERWSLRDLLRRYQSEITPKKKSAAAEHARIDVLLRLPMVHRRLSDLSAQDFAAFRDERLLSVTGSTVIRDLTLFSHLLNTARKEWGIPVENACAEIRRPRENRGRTRRLHPEEEAALLAELSLSSRDPNGNWQPGGCRNPWMRPLVELALATAMRRGELLALQWRDVHLDACYVVLHDSKNGEGREVPLSTHAQGVLRGMERAGQAVFPLTGEAVKRAFTRACTRAGIEDLHFHDLRHEATTRIARRLDNVLELSAVTGHKSLQMLKRYYHPRATELAKKLG